MPYITNKQIMRLIEAEEYFWENLNWRENEETEKALWKIWATTEELAEKKYGENQRAKMYMREKRKINKNYGRSKKNA